MQFFIVDAFTDQMFGGNPAGVVLLPAGEEDPDDEKMQRIAAELRYSETAFVRVISDAEVQIRYFTPEAEVDLCGHATVASFVALTEEGRVKPGEVLLSTKAGDLRVTVEEDGIFMDMASPVLRGEIREPEVAMLYQVMGLDERDAQAALDQEWILLPEIISTGLPDIIFPVINRETLLRIQPDRTALSVLSDSLGVTGVHAFCLGEGLVGDVCDDQEQVTAYCRNFAPLFGIDEEAATGTANGALCYYLFRHALIDDGAECLFLQGESMGRPSKIYGRIEKTADGILVRIGGGGRIVARGDLG